MTIFIGLAQAQSSPLLQNPPAKTWAVVIGISNYPKLGGGQQLKFADSDASAFAEAIKKSGATTETIRLLTNKSATLAAIKDAIGNWLASAPAEEDTVCIYFSGHGFVEKGFNESYLLAFDSDIKTPYSSAISLTEISYALSRRIKAHRILIIGDAVREDFFRTDEDKGGSVTFARTFLQLSEWRAGISVMLANDGGENSREGQRWESHGVFTKYLLDALTNGVDTNRDGITYADEVFAFISSQVAKDTSKKQNPSRSGVTMAQIVLSKPVSAPVQTSQQPSVIRESPTTRVAAPTSPKEVGSGQPSNRKEVASISTPTAPVNESLPERGSISNPEKKISPPINSKPVESNRATSSREDIANNSKSTASSSGSAPKRPTPPPKSTRISSPQPTGTIPSTSSAGNTTIKSESLANPPVPVKTPPTVEAVSTPSVITSTSKERMTSSVPIETTASPPSPLLFDLERALTDGRLIEPKGANAWDLYQQVSQQTASSAEAGRFRTRLVEALLQAGKSIVLGDVRGDNITERVEEFRRAGQMFAKARLMAPEKQEIIPLEKLSAAQALIALQFYDEADRALSQLPRSAATENSLGIVYSGKLDTWRAERAFKNASEIDPTASMPHYNLAQLYRAQKHEGALAEFEKAAALDASNYILLLALGDEHFSQSKWEKAADAYRKAVVLKPLDDTLHTKLGHALYSQGLRDEANKSYQKAKELRSRQ